VFLFNHWIERLQWWAVLYILQVYLSLQHRQLYNSWHLYRGFCHRQWCKLVLYHQTICSHFSEALVYVNVISEKPCVARSSMLFLFLGSEFIRPSRGSDFSGKTLELVERWALKFLLAWLCVRTRLLWTRVCPHWLFYYFLQFQHLRSFCYVRHQFICSFTKMRSSDRAFATNLLLRFTRSLD
jgi:hypothetical protein